MEDLQPDDRPALVRAIFSDDPVAVSAAIASGEDPNAVYAELTLVALAALHGQPEVLTALIAGGATVPTDVLTVLGEMDITDWMIDPICREEDYARVAEILLAHGASPHVIAYNGRPLITTFPEGSYPRLHRALSDALARTDPTARNPDPSLRRRRSGSVTMHKVNTNHMVETSWSSPKGTFAGAGKEISEELGRKPESTDLLERHPFDVEICRIAPGKTPYPYHSHSAQWEFYHVISGSGLVRHQGGTTPVVAGDAFIFKPGEPHQITNDSAEDLVLYVVANNPTGESCHYPDSNKWSVPSPERRLVRSDALDYYDGEE